MKFALCLAVFAATVVSTPIIDQTQASNLLQSESTLTQIGAHHSLASAGHPDLLMMGQTDNEGVVGNFIRGKILKPITDTAKKLVGKEEKARKQHDAYVLLQKYNEQRYEEDDLDKLGQFDAESLDKIIQAVNDMVLEQAAKEAETRGEPVPTLDLELEKELKERLDQWMEHAKSYGEVTDKDVYNSSQKVIEREVRWASQRAVKKTVHRQLKYVLMDARSELWYAYKFYNEKNGDDSIPLEERTGGHKLSLTDAVKARTRVLFVLQQQRQCILQFEWERRYEMDTHILKDKKFENYVKNYKPDDQKEQHRLKERRHEEILNCYV